MKLIIAGSRGFDNYEFLKKTCEHALQNITVTEVVSGTARGADQLGERWASEKGIPVKKFPADWETHGKSAGYIRNSEMADYADLLIAFWDLESRGTKHMIDLAKEKGLQVRVYCYP